MYSIITNQDAHDAITAEFKRYKVEKTARTDRKAFAEGLTEAYFTLHGYWPPPSVLDRLATLILQDELADKHPDKMTREEFPLLSADQEKLRNKDERSIRAADDVATDGYDYRPKNRDSNRRFREVFNV